MKRLLLLFLSTCLPGLASAAYVYNEDFESGTNGWIVSSSSLEPSGGVGNSQYLRGSRNGLAPNFGASTSTAAANMLGDLNTLYSGEITFAYHGRAFTGGNQDVGHIVYNGGTAWWHNSIASIGSYLTDWTLTQFTIDTTWSDVDAVANGWQQLGGSTSWADTWSNVTLHYVFYGWHSGSGTVQGGLDSFSMTGADTGGGASVPNPGVVLLFGAGLLGIMRFRARLSKG